MDPDDLFTEITNQTVEIVLTAHPTQVNRRTLQYKHAKIAALLQQHDRQDLMPEERELVIQDLVREVTALWQTDELRRQKPSPVDEARGGLHVVEQSLWSAVPTFLRRMSSALKKHTGRELPLNATPIKFGSWMGGDRDGNPNVTSKTTHHVTALGRWMAADLYLREVDVLRFELSNNQCSDQVWRMATEILEINKHRGAESSDAASEKVAMTSAHPTQTDEASYPGGMVSGTHPGGSYEQQAMLQAERGAVVPHELPGQDPEGGSEVEYSLEVSEDPSRASTPTTARAAAAAAANPLGRAAADGAGPLPTAGGRPRRSSGATDAAGAAGAAAAGVGAVRVKGIGGSSAAGGDSPSHLRYVGVGSIRAAPLGVVG
ncbi:phosphoenolpyruvate carboxylase [Monoraphidium neglectum]|uniref:Phosphoenolpyruvate carboxylase n=1 Tax=Monoraphidium neglectum TaxID=145388 RepID=A0A0D2MUY2_9CHLO|nr:phosphoenolpyruvate carboxylase [Monoraphidium neglectum]KIZ04332.1 phosphoenolpyruvate carboxylase [Monoraphidium neglectum]|eukprot:XP_013903351.1 phosphoenolpyruvate carboxylase [Monoraphidium neglectum]